MKIAAFIIFLAFTSTAHGGKCRDIVNKILNATRHARFMPMAAHTTGQLVFMPQRKLALRPNIEAVVSLTTSKKTGEQIVQNLENFDRKMETLGLKKSTPTKILISEKVFPLSTQGPLHFVNIFNLWHRSKADDIIIMRPFYYYRQFATDPIALFHERVHSILSVLHKDAYIHNHPIEEGLADYLTAYHVGTPVLKTAEVFVRRIDKISPQLLTASDDPHDMGQAFSYTLWKLQEHIGKEEMKSLLKPFIEGLNQYYESFKKHDNELEKLLRPEYEYFLAVLKKTLRNNSKVQEDEFIDEIATHLKLDATLIDDIADSITKSNKNFYSSSNNRIPSDVIFPLYFLGTMTFAFEISLGFLVLSFLF